MRRLGRKSAPGEEEGREEEGREEEGRREGTAQQAAIRLA